VATAGDGDHDGDNGGDSSSYNYIGYELRSALVDAANAAVRLNPR